jgi:phosphoserine phosphatase
MTTPTRDMLDREEDLVRRADELRKRLTNFKKPQKKPEATLEVTAEAKATEMEIRHIRNEIGKIREQSQVHHESMLLLHRKADEERVKANNAHAKFVEYLNEVKLVDAEYDTVMLQIRGIKDGVRQEELKVEREKMAKVNAKVEELKQEAHRKMASGEKLTFDDLQFIYGGEEDEDEEPQIVDKIDSNQGK